MARALSVCEGKGEVKATASDGRELTFCRGNFWAWLSGPEKSLQTKQMFEVDTEFEGECDELPGRGFVACMADRSGLDDKGIGGGETSVLCSRPFVTAAGF